MQAGTRQSLGSVPTSERVAIAWYSLVAIRTDVAPKRPGRPPRVLFRARCTTRLVWQDDLPQPERFEAERDASDWPVTDRLCKTRPRSRWPPRTEGDGYGVAQGRNRALRGGTPRALRRATRLSHYGTADQSDPRNPVAFAHPDPGHLLRPGG